MMKKLGLTTITLSVLLLSGCGGGGSKSTTEKLKEKNAIGIYHNIQQGSCNLALFKANYFVNPVLFEEPNTVSCQNTYKRTTNSNLKGEYCREVYSELAGNVSCVVGFDDFGIAALTKKSNNIPATEYIIGDIPVL